MTSWPEATLVVCGVVLAAFFAGSETGAYVLNRLRLRYRAGAGLRRAKLLLGLVGDLPGFVTALLIWTNLSHYLVSAAFTSLFERLEIGIDPEFAATFAAAPVLFVFSELAPKNLYRQRADALMLSGALALRSAERLARPVAWTLSGLARAVSKTLRLREGPERGWAYVSRRALREGFAEGEAQGLFSGPQKLLVENILQAGSRPAAQAAKPLNTCTVLDASATAADLLARAGELPSSRVPICDGGSGLVVGVVHVLRAWGSPPGTELRDLALPPVWIDADASVVRVLAALRRASATVGFLAEPDGRPDGGEEGGRHARAVVTVEGLLRHMIAGGGS